MVPLPDSVAPSSSNGSKSEYVTDTQPSIDSAKLESGIAEKDLGKWGRFKYSFQRADLSEFEELSLTKEEKTALALAKSPFSQALKPRHLQMIAIGGSIGTGLFVGSGKALSQGGPGSLLIAFFLVGIMLYCTIQSLGELTVRYPKSSSFSTFSTRFVDPAWGFSMGWNYGLQWLIVFPLELVAASITIQYWSKNINPVVWVIIFYFGILLINLFGVKGYGEAEFIFSWVKVISVLGFIIFGIVINCGGGPNGGYIGGKYWIDPGAFNHGFKGLCSVFVTAAFSFSGTELVGLAAGETKNPQKTFPRATKQVVWRIVLFYLLSLTIVGLIVPYTDPALLGESSAQATSPFVIAIKNAGVSVLPSVMNAVVLIALISVGNSAVFGCSRTLVSLANQDHAPAILNYIDNAGRPLIGFILSAIFGLLGFVTATPTHHEVFAWLLALTGLSAVFTWGSICLCHIRFRAAMKAQGRSLDELAFTSLTGAWGSWFGLVSNFLILIAQFWTALFPIGSDGADVISFFKAYLAAPIVIVCYVGYKLWYKTSWIRLEDIDLDLGRKDLDMDVIRAELKEERDMINSRGFFYRMFRFWC